MTVHPSAFVHETAVVDEGAVVEEGAKIWHFVHVSKGARIGPKSVLGQNVFVAPNVPVGRGVKIQNNVSLYVGVTVEDGVFVGPHVCFTNDKVPRAVNPDMSLKSAHDWVVAKTLVKAGAALGANSTIVCGTTVGRWAMVASGSVVTKDVPDHALVMGNPARFYAWVCSCGQKVKLDEGTGRGTCTCGRTLAKGADGKVAHA